MNIAVRLRQENVSLMRDMIAAGHNVYCERSVAVQYRQVYNLPIMPWDIGNSAFDLPAPFAYGNSLRGVIDAVHSLNDEVGLDAVVVWTDAPPDERATVLAARHLGIPTFEVVHGATNTYRQGHFEYESYVDYVLAPGQHEADFRKFYGSSANVVVTGKPSFDWITQSGDLCLTRDQAREHFKVPEKRPVIMYAMTWRHPFSVWERDTDPGDREVIEAHMNLLPLCNSFLLIKPHYSQGTREYADALRKHCDEQGVTDYAVMTGGPIVPLTMSDLVVTHKSSIIVECMLLDIPAVMFEFRERNDFSWFKGYGAELVAHREDLYSAMARCLLDKATKERLAAERPLGREYFNYKCDGKAGERCVQFIEQVVAERTQPNTLTAVN
jgi:hypothetical protein